MVTDHDGDHDGDLNLGDHVDLHRDDRGDQDRGDVDHGLGDLKHGDLHHGDLHQVDLDYGDHGDPCYHHVTTP